jgi:hypothetical protein
MRDGEGKEGDERKCWGGRLLMGIAGALLMRARRGRRAGRANGETSGWWRSGTAERVGREWQQVAAAALQHPH